MSVGNYQKMAAAYRRGIIDSESNGIFQYFVRTPAKRAFAFHTDDPLNKSQSASCRAATGRTPHHDPKKGTSEYGRSQRTSLRVALP